MRRMLGRWQALSCVLLMSCGGSKSKTETVYVETPAKNSSPLAQSTECSVEFAERCREVQSKIEAASLSLKTATESKREQDIHNAQLTLNEWMEVRESYRRGVDNEAAIHARYESLRQIIDANSTQQDSGYKLVYSSEELLATREVLNDFGELTLDPMAIQEPQTSSMTSLVYKIDDAALPWAAYWYPKRSTELFEGDASPLVKLDSYFRASGVESAAARWEADNHEPQAAEWEGLCDAWAIASTLTQEPKVDVTINDITFTPSDLKALAIKYFEGYSPKIYGRRYQGSAGTDGQIQDLRPEAFHKIVAEVIGKQKKPIVIDEDPGPEIWSKPLFRMSFKITRDIEYQNAVLVDAYPWMIRQRAGITNNPTSVQRDLAAPLYQYRLFYNPELNAEGHFTVVAGEWIGTSINFHPDMVFIPGDPENANQGNKELRRNHSAIRKLLIRVGMLKG